MSNLSPRELESLAADLIPYIGLASVSDVTVLSTPIQHGINDATFHSGVPALLANGSVTLQGNLTVAAGVTLDGVDLSELDIPDPVTIGEGGLSSKLHLTGQVLTLDSINHSELGNIGANDHHAAVTAGTGISVTGQQVGINLDADLTWTGEHIFQDTVTFQDTTTFQETITVQDILPAATDTYMLGSSTRWFAGQFVSTINATVFAETVQQIMGGQFCVGHDSGVLAADVGASDTTIDFGQAMALNDYVVIKAHDADGNAKTEYLQVGAVVSETTYNVTRDAAAANSPDPAWSAGTPYLVLGNDGDGRIVLDATSTPRFSIIIQGDAAYNDITEVVRLGDLNGSFGVASTLHGFGVGDYTAGNYLRYDTSDGFTLSAGGGGIVLDATGLSIPVQTAPSTDRYVKFMSGIYPVSYLRGYYPAGKNHLDLVLYPMSGRDAYFNVTCEGPTGKHGEIVLDALNDTGHATVTIRMDPTTGSTIDLYAPSGITANSSPVPCPSGTALFYLGVTLPTGYLWADGTAVSRATYAGLFSALCPSLGTCTMTLATPCVVTKTAHGMRAGDSFYFTTTGALPTGVAANTLYYVLSTSLTADTFRFAATRGGTAINSSVGQSGDHTIMRCPWGLGDGSTTFNVPDLRDRVPVGAGTIADTSLGNTDAVAEASRVGAKHTHTTDTHKHRAPVGELTTILGWNSTPPFGTSGTVSCDLSVAGASNPGSYNCPLTDNGGGGSTSSSGPSFAIGGWIIKT